MGWKHHEYMITETAIPLGIVPMAQSLFTIIHSPHLHVGLFKVTSLRDKHLERIKN